MPKSSHFESAINTNKSVDVVDLLITEPSKKSFNNRVQELNLSNTLEQKINDACIGNLQHSGVHIRLSQLEEKELATEVLILRHKFTELVWQTKHFNQAALTIIQNIYLFRNRKIFFDPSGSLYEEERQKALLIFTSYKKRQSLPLRNTFQHLIIARVWNRITSQYSHRHDNLTELAELTHIVEQLNTIRNIYVLLTTGLVNKIVSQLGDIYKEGLSDEDVQQIGTFGVARAAYRYHHSCGIRFSTYAANWIRKEVQRQSLDGRLIKISTNTIEQYSLAQKTDDTEKLNVYSEIIKKCSCMHESDATVGDLNVGLLDSRTSEQEIVFEKKELSQNIQQIITSSLPPKENDIINRRYGLAQHVGNPQSIISISKTYGVTRSSIYQLEKKALKTLKKALNFSLADIY